MIKKEHTYSAFEISWAGFIPHSKTTRTVVSWLNRYKKKYPSRVIVREYPKYTRQNGKVCENKRYSITGENLISLVDDIKNGKI